MTNVPEPRQRLLVAGPDPEDRALTVQALTVLGYDVVAQTPSGLDAIEAVASHRPDLVLVSAGLRETPGGPGAARAIDDIYGIPVVVVAGEGRERCRRTPDSLSYVLLRKPFDLNDLEAAVETALRRPMPEGDRGIASASSADRDERFTVLVPSGEVTSMSRDIEVGRDVDPDPSGEGGPVNPTP